MNDWYKWTFEPFLGEVMSKSEDFDLTRLSQETTPSLGNEIGDKQRIRKHEQRQDAVTGDCLFLPLRDQYKPENKKLYGSDVRNDFNQICFHRTSLVPLILFQQGPNKINKFDGIMIHENIMC